MSWIMDLLKALGGVCRTRPLDPTLWDLQGDRVTVDLSNSPELAAAGGAVYLAGKGLPSAVLVARKPDSGFVCVENRCTHMGRKLDPEPDGKTLRCCSVSHSTFDYDGNKITGPAKGPVRVYNCRETDGKLVISLK